jgi:hypothetical protein
LSLHQPDEDQPAQLLGTCDCCCRWYFLIDCEPDQEETVLFELPSAGMIRAMFAAPVAPCS